MASIALVGATSFVGQGLLRRLVAQGDRVVAVTFADRPKDAVALGGLLQHERVLKAAVRSVQLQREGGAANRKVLAELLDSVTSVVYCTDDQRGRCLEDFLAGNVAGLACLLDPLRQRTDIPLLHLSSIAALRPEVSWYSRSKAAAEDLLQQHLRSSAELGTRLPWTVLRLPAVYGPGKSELSLLLRSLRRGFVPVPGSLEQRLSLLHIEDLAEAVSAWLSNPAACAGDSYALDDGHIVGYDWGQIAQAASPGSHHLVPIPAWLLQLTASANLALSKRFNYAPLLTPGKVRELNTPDWVCDSSAFCDATGWQPRFDLTSGLQGL